MATTKKHWRGIHGLLTPEIVKKYASQGLTLKEIAKLYDCGAPNIHHAIHNDEELCAAWEQGHLELLVEYTGHLKKRAFENDTLLMFALKTQCGYVEQQYLVGKQLDVEKLPRVQIFLPDNGRDIPHIESD